MRLVELPGIEDDSIIINPEHVIAIEPTTGSPWARLRCNGFSYIVGVKPAEAVLLLQGTAKAPPRKARELG